MAQSTTLIQANFISGEVSPLLEGRIDSPKYQTGLRKCQNGIPIRQGGVIKRQGTHYIGATLGNKAARLVEYTALNGDSYILEFTDTKMRIWTSAMALVGGGTPTEITTPWVEAHLDQLSFACMKGVLWIVHPSYAPRNITSATWAVTTPTFTGDRTFAATDKYPKSVFFFSGRLGLAATNEEPNAIFLSRSPVTLTGADRFTDFTMGTAADHAIYLQESDLNGTHIHWVIAQRRLIMGSNRSIWMDAGGIVTPATFDMSLIAYNGAEEIPPVLIESIILYAGKGGTSLHALSFSEEGGGFVDYDLSMDAEHFLASPIVEMKAMAYPHPILWIARADGMLVSCTIDFKNGMIAWAEHPMANGAVVENLAVTSTDTEDGMFMVVKRGTDRYVEQLHFHNIGTQAQEDMHYVDCGLTFTYGSPTDTVTGLAHLEGYSVVALADGAILPAKTVPASGILTYDTTFSKIHIGMPIEEELETLRPEIPVQGTSQGKVKNIIDISLRLYRSMGGSVSTRLGTAVKLLYWISGTYIYGSVLPLYTDTKKTQLGAALDADTTVIIRHNDPVPFNLLAVIYRVALVEY